MSDDCTPQSKTGDRVSQSTLDGCAVSRPTCKPPHHPNACENLVDRVITVYYGGPAMSEIDWMVCSEHADNVRETGEVQEDRPYREDVDGFSEVSA